MYNSNLDNSSTKEVTTIKEKKSVVAGEEVVLNDGFQEEIDEKDNSKKPLDKKVVIGIICILAFVVCTIMFFGVFGNKKKIDGEDGLIYESNLLSKVGEKYEGLNYLTKKVKLVEQGFFYDYSVNREGNKVDVSYIEVEGLKNKDLEQKINDKLKDIAEKMYNSDNLVDSNVLYDHIYNYTDVYIFNNVLSTMYCEEKSDIEGNVEYHYKGVNINLKDFKEFAINDVFVNSTNMDELFDIEDWDNVEYAVSPKNVYYLSKKGKISVVNLYENMDKVAIYKRFYTEQKLFEKTYKASPYVFTTKKFFETDYYGLEESNLFIDTCNGIINVELDEKIVSAVSMLYKEAVNKAKNLSYSNPSKRYLVQIVPNVKKNEEDNTYSINVKYTCYEINKSYFNQNIEKFVVFAENTSKEEINTIKYFNDKMEEYNKHLENKKEEVLHKEVDKEGKEISNETDKSMGLS